LHTLQMIRPASWAKALIYALLLFCIYSSALHWLLIRDWARDGYSYAYLVPFVVLYLIWTKKDVLEALPSFSSWKGMILLVPGIILFWLGELGGEFYTVYISLWLVLVSLFWLHNGWQKLRSIGFSFFFMLTMFPIPNFINTKLTLKLRLISSELGVAMIQACGLPAYREGNVIDLSFTQLQVVDACSGLNSLISLFVLALLMTYFFKAHFWKRAVLLLSTVPLAIITNSMRIAMTALLYKFWGAEVAQGFFHTFSGLLIFMVCMPFLLFEMWVLGKLPPFSPALVSGSPDLKPTMVKTKKGEVTVTPTGRRKYCQAVFISAVALLGATIALSHSIEFRDKIPIKKSFDRFPLQVGEWTGIRKTMEQNFINNLDFSDYVIVNYEDKQGRNVELYVAYYESQRKGVSIHSPATCLPGSGWTFNQSGSTTLFLPDHNRSINVNRAFSQKGIDKQLSYYWFPGRGRVLTNLYQLKIFAFWDALTRQRTDGALVRLITPIYKSDELVEAETSLKEFAGNIIPVLDEFIPD